MSHYYPKDLVAPLRELWDEPLPEPHRRHTTLPPDEAIESLLSVSYQTSLLKEEGRKLTFRIIVLPRKKSVGKSSPIDEKLRIVRFKKPRPLSIGELRRLAPSAETIRSLIAVAMNSRSEWEIWGLVDTGSNWWEFIHHEAEGGSPPPEALTVTSAGPGEIILSSSGDTILTLRSGKIYKPQIDVLWQGELSKYFSASRTALYKEAVKKLSAEKWDEAGHDEDYPKRFYNFCIARLLNAVKEKGHGGTVIIVSDQMTSDDSRLLDRLTLKYPCTYDYLWSLMVRHLETHRRYYDLHLPMWDAKEPIDPTLVREQFVIDAQRIEVNEALSDCFKFLGSMSAVDGALVITDKFRVIGFGAEITAQSPTLKHVVLEQGQVNDKNAQVSIEGYGTRHRSAFRFCSSFEDAVAFIVSQDGGVKGVKRVRNLVHMWPDISLTHYGV